jgi:hypothetical protein
MYQIKTMTGYYSGRPEAWAQLCCVLLLAAYSAKAQIPQDFVKRNNPLKTSASSRSTQLGKVITGGIVATAGSAPVPLSPSIFVFAVADVDGTDNTCTNQVDQAAKFGTNRLQLVLTTNGIDNNQDTIVDSYAVRVGYKNGQPVNAAWDTQGVLVDRLHTGIRNCLRYATTRGFNVFTLNPRLDMLPFGYWRVSAQFNPLQLLGGVSYYSTILHPMVNTGRVLNSIKPGVTVRLVLGGEMHFTLSYAPEAYSHAVSVLKQSAIGLRFEVGAHLTPWELCASQCSQIAPAARSSLTTLLNSMDFIGISMYPQVQVNLYPAMLQWEILEMQAVLYANRLSVDLSSFSGRGRLYILEVGWGGGISDAGDQPARTSEQVASFPWLGINTGYDSKKDPWVQFAVDDTNVPTRIWLRKAYQYLLWWLKNGGGPDFRVSEAYAWSLVSWDVMGIHPASFDSNGVNGYKDRVIGNWIKGHNAAITGVPVTSYFQIRTQTGELVGKPCA